MRVFISVNLPKEICSYLYNLQQRLRKDINAKIKWVSKSQLHITLKFLGFIDGNKLKEVKMRLSKIKHNKFILDLNDLGVFPNINYARVLWIGVNEEKLVLELQKLIDGELLDLFPKEEKFSAHITLGRIKVIKDKDKFKNALNKIKIEKKSFEVNEFALMESVLRKDGAVYSVLNVYGLSR